MVAQPRLLRGGTRKKRERRKKKNRIEKKTEKKARSPRGPGTPTTRPPQTLLPAGRLRQNPRPQHPQHHPSLFSIGTSISRPLPYPLHLHNTHNTLRLSMALPPPPLQHCLCLAWAHLCPTQPPHHQCTTHQPSPRHPPSPPPLSTTLLWSRPPPPRLSLWDPLPRSPPPLSHQPMDPHMCLLLHRPSSSRLSLFQLPLRQQR